MARWLPVGLVLLLAGCASQSSLDGIRIPDPNRQGGKFVVRHQVNDDRDLDAVIVEALRSHGFQAEQGFEAGPDDYVVTYVDRWYWDMRTYMIDLRIDVRESGSEMLVGSARSYQTSLAAMGKSYQQVIQNVVDVLVAGLPAKTAKRK